MTTRPRPEAQGRENDFEGLAVITKTYNTKPRPKVLSVRAPLSSCGEQDRIIIEKMNDGYQHYESVCIGGNEILLRFRLK